MSNLNTIVPRFIMFITVSIFACSTTTSSRNTSDQAKQLENNQSPTEMNEKEVIGYIIQLNRSTFPEIIEYELKQGAEERPDPVKAEKYDRFVKDIIYKFAEDKLGINSKDIYNHYSGVILGFAAHVQKAKEEAFLKKLSELKEVMAFEKDGEVKAF